jgi:hypothetical protein
MKKGFLLLLLAVPAFAEGDWNDANELYRKGKYAPAAEIFGALSRAAPDNPYLHYNLANAYFKEGSPASLGRANLEYWRAYVLLPRDADVRFNLDFALKRSGGSLVPGGVPPSLHYLFYALSEGELLGLCWLGWWLGLLFASGALLLEERLRPRLRPWIAVGFAVWAVAGAWWGMRRLADIPNMGVVVEAATEARSGPGSNFSVTFNPPQGRRISVVSRQGDWMEIEMIKEGLRGWVPAKAVEQVGTL